MRRDAQISPVENSSVPVEYDTVLIPVREKFKKVALFLNFDNPEEEKQYRKFVEDQVPLEILQILVLLVIVVLLWIAYSIRNFSWYHIITGNVRLLALPFLLMYYFRLKYKDFNPSIYFNATATQLDNAYVTMHCLTGLFALWCRCRYGPCDDEANFVCNPLYHIDAAPFDTLFFNALVPLTSSAITQTITWKIGVFIAALNGVGTLVICVVYDLTGSTMFPLFMFLALIVLIEYFLHRHSIQSFITVSTFESTIRRQLALENEKTLQAMQSRELRHLIGNVAHDLKTPLSAIVMELDNLSECISSRGRAESVKTLKISAAFMSMMVNRAIDFTKASVGISLVPSMETVDLYKAVQWVQTCVGESPFGVPVKIDICNDLCRYVVTDKRWFIENLMCLLSNAVKFSFEGEIVVRCSVTDSSESTANSVGSHSNPTPARFSTRRIAPYSIRSDKHEASDHAIRSYVPQSTNFSSSSPRESSDRSVDSTSFLHVEVQDSGIGIVKVADMAKLFQPLTQAQRHAGGTGLGVYSLSKRIEALGGYCGVTGRNDSQNGSIFWFKIPYRPDHYSRHCARGLDRTSFSDMEESQLTIKSPHSYSQNFDVLLGEQKSDDRADENPGIGIGITHDFGNDSAAVTTITDSPHQGAVIIDNIRSPYKVLVVDDSTVILKTTSRIFKIAGYDVDIASNGAHCLQMMENNQYAVILIDLQMPVLDGLETIKKIRKSEALSTTTLNSTDTQDDVENGQSNEIIDWGKMPSHHHQFVIGMSANSDSATEEEAMAAGMDAFLAKPVSLQQVLDICSRAGVALTTTPSSHL